MAWYSKPTGGGTGGAPVYYLDQLLDVATGAPTPGQALVWDGSNWVPMTVSAGASSIDQLTDVNTVSNPPLPGQTLVWNGTNWVPGAAATGGAQAIDQLLDVDTVATPPATGQALVWNGTVWIPGTPPPAPVNNYVPAVMSNQTVFTLPTAPINPSATRVLINGVEYYNADSYTLSGTTLTWLNEFRLTAADEVRIIYI